MPTVAPAPITVITFEATISQHVLTKIHIDGDAKYCRSLLLEEFDDVLVDNLANKLLVR